MASSVIHMCVAHEINKKLKRNEDQLLIGTISPDISKLIGESRALSHFVDDIESNIPNIDRFLDKYKNNLNDDFVMGYFIHLYTDYLWFKYFISEIRDKNLIKKLDGSIVKCTDGMYLLYIYNDYTNLNTKLLDEYDMNLSIFYNELPSFKHIIDEIPMDKVNLIVDKAGIIIENTKVHKDMVFNIDSIKTFISTSSDLIFSVIDELV